MTEIVEKCTTPVTHKHFKRSINMSLFGNLPDAIKSTQKTQLASTTRSNDLARSMKARVKAFGVLCISSGVGKLANGEDSVYFDLSAWKPTNASKYRSL